MAERLVFTITDPIGLHARPATYLVNRANKFASNLDIIYNGKKVDLKSIFGVMALAVPTEGQVEIIADGEDEKEAIVALSKVVKEQRIGEKV